MDVKSIFTRRSLKRRSARLSAVTTPEAAVITGVILISAMLLILAGLYFHDKNVLAGAAYEAAQVGKERLRAEDEDVTQACFRERTEGKLILFSGTACSVSRSEDELSIDAAAAKRQMRVRTGAHAAVTIPEKKLRQK